MSAQPRIAVRFRVDPVACDAYGYCAELLPERVTLDEWGYPVVDGTPVDGDLVAFATRAAAECPRRAVLLEAVPVRRQGQPGSAPDGDGPGGRNVPSVGGFRRHP
ncbi:MAG TPA: ferredoxin [Acidimicrobiales bacterium]|nr:ferredoxin [Acidimicrobiales bacterium]